MKKKLERLLPGLKSALKRGLGQGLMAWAAAAFIAGPAAAAPYPEQPVHLIVAFAPGTGSDALSRLLAQSMEGPLGQSVIVENRPGGGGILGTDYVARANPDGYTLTTGTTSTLLTNPLLNSNARYKVEKDFRAICGLARSAFVIVTANTPQAPKTLRELAARLKAGNATYASSGMGTIVHLTGERFVRTVGAKATHVPYKGSAQSLSDVAAGVTLFSAETTAAALPLIRGGKLRALAVTSETRTAELPDVPTVIESGYPGFTSYSWFALMAPAGTPDNMVAKLSASAQAALGTPKMSRQLKTLGFEPMQLGPDQTKAFISKESVFWTDFLQKTGIRLE
ncbi:hypothetical protein CAL29_15945 [Bordetella genomosp. 10]|uniref:ABC transporter substrate-binding protein n=1 Tax=Bordetella genomosp. 10 TaxID=1416804 RepID=A0A261SCZ8_9BORD|nr:tripartite tricarboxylate transporter substrate binding protein [Bordetella genomosp. 10]OZI34941.1 hypothetical protein CAL29_15945 [Bordetella genomosp. 10]